MSVTTRIGVYGLVRSRTGSIELPEEITLACPQCGTKCADKGNCLLDLRPFPDPASGRPGPEVKLVVDCRVCGCDGRPPIVFLPGSPCVQELERIRAEIESGEEVGRDDDDHGPFGPHPFRTPSEGPRPKKKY